MQKLQYHAWDDHQFKEEENEFVGESTQAEITSLDAGLNMEGIPALIVSDLVIKIFHSVPNKIDQPKEELWKNPLQVTKPDMHNPIHSSTPTSFQISLTTFHATQSIMVLVSC